MNIPDHPYQCPDDINKARMSAVQYEAYHSGVLDAIHNEGYEAGKENRPTSDCPYNHKDHHYWVVDSWLDGYYAGKLAARREQERKERA